MTVSTTNVSTQFDADGSTTNFSFSFQALTKDEVEVLGTNLTNSTLNGIAPFTTGVFVRGQAYALSLFDPGGTVSFGAAPSTGIRITIRRTSRLTQEIDYVENDPFPAETHEEGLDRSVLRDQERVEALERTLRLQAGDDQQINMELPFKEFRKNTFLGFDNNGRPTTLSGVLDGTIPVSSFAETLIDDADAQEARSTLGVQGAADRFDETSGTSSSYTASPNAPTALASGETVFLEPHVSNDAGATLNVNSTGAKFIFQETGGLIKADQFNGYKVLIFDVTLDSGNGGWVMLGSNPAYFGGQPASYYEDIPARLGFTPLNKAGGTMTGTLTMKHQVPIRGLNSSGNVRNIATIDNNDDLQIGDVNLSGDLNLNASGSTGFVKANNNVIITEGNDSNRGLLQLAASVLITSPPTDKAFSGREGMLKVTAAGRNTTGSGTPDWGEFIVQTDPAFTIGGARIDGSGDIDLVGTASGEFTLRFKSQDRYFVSVMRINP